MEGDTTKKKRNNSKTMSSNASELGSVGLKEHESKDDMPTKQPETPNKKEQTNPKLNIVSPTISQNSKQRARAGTAMTETSKKRENNNDNSNNNSSKRGRNSGEESSEEESSNEDAAKIDETDTAKTLELFNRGRDTDNEADDSRTTVLALAKARDHAICTDLGYESCENNPSWDPFNEISADAPKKIAATQSPNILQFAGSKFKRHDGDIPQKKSVGQEQSN